MKKKNIRKKQIKIRSINIDKAEYQEIILSNTNRPEDFYKKLKKN